MGGLASQFILMVDGSPYRVLTFEEGLEEGFKTGCAYHRKTFLDDRVYPYRGKLKSLKKLKSDMPAGIYVSESTGDWVIQYPRKAQWDAYDPAAVRQFNEDAIHSDVSFINTDIDLQADGDIFYPPIRPEDDMMSKVVKYAIRLKGIVFDAYKTRFDTMGSAGKTGKSSTNNKNNAKRALIENHSLSANKAKEYGDVLEYQIAIVIADKPGAANKMNTDGRPIVIFSDDPFDISDVIDISTMDFSEAAVRSTGDDDFDEEVFKKPKKKKRDDDLPWDD